MLFYTVGQSRVFLMLMYVGLGLGAWYSLLDVMRRLMVAGPLLSLMIDLIFGAGAAALIILGTLRVCQGELRLYAILGALCGCLLFRWAILPPARALVRWLGRLFTHLRQRPLVLLRKIFR